MLHEIADAFDLAIDERLGVVRAEVTSAEPLDNAQRDRIQEELTRVAGKQARCEFSVNPDLIGGVVARIGSTVYDGSVRSQLENLRERLIAN
jgi:F-type H+-transporting ATPase subunit delta